MPKGGARGQNLGHPKKCPTAFFFLCLPNLKTLCQTSVTHMTQPVMSLDDGQGDLYFMVE